MSVLFSTLAFFGLIATAVSGIVWLIGRLQHRATKAWAACVAAALVTVISFVAFGVTHEPTEKVEEPPAKESAELAAVPNTTQPPVTTPEPNTMPEPTLSQTPNLEPGTATTPEKPERDTDSTATSEQNPVEEIDPVEQAKQDIEEAARQIVTDNYTQTDVESMTVNENHGTDEDGDYILLAYLTWNVKNSAKMTKEMLAMYSEDFAARVGKDLENVQEFAVFWTVPYYSETETAGKYSYERRGEGMYQTDCMIMIAE